MKKKSPTTQPEEAATVEDRLNSIERSATLLRQCSAAQLRDDQPPDEEMIDEASAAMTLLAEAIFEDSRAIRRALGDSNPTYALKAPGSSWWPS
jgi:hypothetical protein